eukprot:703314-Rhodomonas_salina.2
MHLHTLAQRHTQRPKQRQKQRQTRRQTDRHVTGQTDKQIERDRHSQTDTCGLGVQTVHTTGMHTTCPFARPSTRRATPPRSTVRLRLSLRLTARKMPALAEAAAPRERARLFAERLSVSVIADPCSCPPVTRLAQPPLQQNTRVPSWNGSVLVSARGFPGFFSLWVLGLRILGFQSLGSRGRIRGSLKVCVEGAEVKSGARVPGQVQVPVIQVQSSS